ncbi:MAG TPA: copper resistance protein CopC [Anaerolineaceae bacterium]|nr:copper resistance protein CopC [Anaerolineaceae bacterium]
MRRIFLVLSILLLASLAPSGRVSAHSNLVRSDPENGAVLEKSPAQVTLEFSETPDAAFSTYQIIEATAQQPVPVTVVVDASQAEIVRLLFPPLKNGVYSVQWKVRSAVDGHIINSSITFSVGQPLTALSLLPPVGAPDPATILPAWVEVCISWLTYASLALGLGSFSFVLLVWKPALRRSGGTGPAPREINDLFVRTSLVGLLALVVFSIAGFVYEAIQLGIGPGNSLIPLLQSQTSLLLLARIVLAMFLVVWTLRLPPPSTGAFGKWWLALALGVAVLATFSLKSHLAATGSALNVLIETLHLGSMVAWMGGLVPLFLVILATQAGKNQPVPLSVLIPMFSRLALVCVTGLALSGLYSALVEVRTLPALTITTYGLAVVAKSGLFALLFVLGAVNLLVLSPRLARLGSAASLWLSRTVPVELALGLVVLAVAGVLTASNPAFTALNARQAQGYVGSYAVDGIHFILRAAPLQIGVNEFGVDFQNPGGADPLTSQVLLRLYPPQSSLGVTQIATKAEDGGSRYSARGSYFPADGKWQVEVILRRTGMNDVRHTFDVTVQGAAAAASEDDTPNPFPAEAASIASGLAVYQRNCSSCHGVTGNGNGPLATGLNPPPADLTKHAAIGIHTDGQLFRWISDGYPNSAMPAFANSLTEKQRWDLVNYIRTLAVGN